MIDRPNPAGMTDPDDGQPLLSALLDGELSPAEREALEARLAADPAAASRLAHYRAQKRALQALFPAERAPSSVWVMRRASWPRFVLLGACCLMLGLGAGLGARWLAAYGEPPGFVQRADSAYALYVPESRHAVERGGDEQTLNWLSRRLGRTVRAPSLDEYGYTLLGSRLLPDAGGAAAVQLMYQNGRGERLTLYVTASGKPVQGFGAVHRAGHRTIYWTTAGTGYALSGGGGETQLRQMAADACLALGGQAEGWAG